MRLLTSIATLFLLPTLLFSQTIEIAGEVKEKQALKLSDLEALPHITVKGREHDGSEHVFEGVPVWEILQRFDVPLGENLRGKAMSLYLRATATDGYRAIYSLSELDPLNTDGAVILAYKQDGALLSPTQGPFRLILPKEKRHARWVRQVIRLEVLRAPAS